MLHSAQQADGNMDVRWRIELLGGLRARQQSRVLTHFRTQKTGVLLAYLACYCQQAHPREALIELLWSESDVGAGRASLSTALSSLRHQLEPPGVIGGTILIADRFSVQLNPDAVTTDVAEFSAQLQSAAQALSTIERVKFLTEAVKLYCGEFLPGYYEEWILPEQQRLAEQFFQALCQLVPLLEQAGSFSRALDYAYRAVSIDPLREEAHRELMRLLVAFGRPSAALRQYQHLERILEEQLHDTPSEAVREFARRLKGSPATGQSTSARRASWSQQPATREFHLTPLFTHCTRQTTFLLVHSSWHGGWCWRRVEALLRHAGHQVFTPTLAGLGERAHLLSPQIDLNTHIQDVLGVLEYEDLQQVVLVGHSYGGMVITAVAERAASRLAHLVYLDALVPEDGQSLLDLGPQHLKTIILDQARLLGEGWWLPPVGPEDFGVTAEADARWLGSKLVAHPLKTWEQPVRLVNLSVALPRTYIICTKIPEPLASIFAPFVQRARSEPGWRYRELATAHNAMITSPQQLAELLLELA